MTRAWKRSPWRSTMSPIWDSFDLTGRVRLVAPPAPSRSSSAQAAPRCGRSRAARVKETRCPKRRADRILADSLRRGDCYRRAGSTSCAFCNTCPLLRNRWRLIWTGSAATHRLLPSPLWGFTASRSARSSSRDLRGRWTASAEPTRARSPLPTGFLGHRRRS